MLCALGFHCWITREATFRSGTFVSRCTRCGAVRVKHRARR